MGENYLTIAGHFFGHFIKIALFGRDDGSGFFAVAKFESFEIIELGPFLGGSGLTPCTECDPISRTVGHTGSAISPWCFSSEL